jgi:hypothetical protein
LKNELDRKCILQMAMGAIEERVDYEMGKVIDNILDRNVKATAKRKVTVTLELTPDDDRKSIRVSATAKSALVATNPIATSLFITSDPSSGEMVVAEMVAQVPGQIAMDGSVQSEPKVLKLLKNA